MSTHHVMYQVMYPREMTSTNHYIVFTQTEGKIFFNPSSDKCCRRHLIVVHKCCRRHLIVVHKCCRRHLIVVHKRCRHLIVVHKRCRHLTVVHKIKQVLYRYYLNKANTFVLHSIWVNTVNNDVIMNEEILVFHFQIRKLYTAILLYSNLQNQKIYTEVSAAPSQVCSVQTVHTLQSGYARP